MEYSSQFRLPNTLKSIYKIPCHHLNTRPSRHNAHPHRPPHPDYPKPPLHIQHNHIQYPIHSILNDRPHTYTDTHQITKTYTSYLCQWTLPNATTYNKWLPQKALFPWNNPHTINHNISLLTQYYTHKQHEHFTNILHVNFNATQLRDTRYISPPHLLPLCHIHINECNPDNDIACTQNTIQTEHGVSHIYDSDIRHLITIPEQRLNWLWDQYQNALSRQITLEPPPQSFEQEVVWLYQRYKYRLSKNDPLKLSQYTLPNAILATLIHSFHITQSYFSSPVTCPTQLTKFSSTFSRDKVFGSIGTAFQHKWTGNGYAHPHTESDTQQALHWARLAAQNNPDTITILITTDPNWYHNLNPHVGPFPDSHVITHFKADTITYDEPTIPPELQIDPRTESRDITILCIHHKTTSVGPTNYARTMYNIATSLQIPTSYHTTANPTPMNTPVNRSKNWSQLLYPPPLPLTRIHHTPPQSQTPQYAYPPSTPHNIVTIPMAPLYHPKPLQRNTGTEKKRDTAYIVPLRTFKLR